jgi:hypothetical protein
VASPIVTSSGLKNLTFSPALEPKGRPFREVCAVTKATKHGLDCRLDLELTGQAKGRNRIKLIFVQFLCFCGVITRVFAES